MALACACTTVLALSIDPEVVNDINPQQNAEKTKEEDNYEGINIARAGARN